MVNPQLVEYIKTQLSSGVAEIDIAKAATASGWSVQDISDSVSAAKAPLTSPPAPSAPMASRPPVQVMPSMQHMPPIVVSETEVAQMAAAKPHAKIGGIIRAVVFACLILALLGGVSYAYIEKLGPFSRPPYTEQNLFSGILSSFANIQSSSYSATVSFDVSPRDADASPLVIDEAQEEKVMEKYASDSMRMQEAGRILQALSARSTYPESLSSIGYGSSRAFVYTVTDNGRDFSLATTFETRAAVSGVQRAYGFYATTTKIQGMSVTFTKGSPKYLYMSSTPPKPALVQMGEALRMLPVDAKGQASVSATADWSKVESTDWKFNFDATGDYGDLTFKVNADAVHKDPSYYFRINNMPGLFTAYLGDIKGKWISLDTSKKDGDITDRNELSFIPEAEKNYKKSREEFVKYLKEIVRIADEEQVFSFRNPPATDKIGGRVLYKYELVLRREAVVPFYKKLVEYAKKESDQSRVVSLAYLDDPDQLEYLESPEFQTMLDQYENNTKLTLWVDEKGNPARLEYYMRVIPPDDAPALKDKQVNVTFALDIKDINVPLTIEAPEGARPFEDIKKEMEEGGGTTSALSSSRIKSRDARRVADIKQLQVALELYYDAKTAYPATLTSLVPNYIASVPKDPSTNVVYAYALVPKQLAGDGCGPGYGFSCSTYILKATLESASYTGLNTDVDGTVGEVNCADNVKAYCVAP